MHTDDRKESIMAQHCIKTIAGEVVNSSSKHLLNFGAGGQVIALKSAAALILPVTHHFEKTENPALISGRIFLNNHLSKAKQYRIDS